MKKILIYALGGFLMMSCANKLDVAPPNNITDEQIQELLRSGDEETIQLVLGGMANNMPKMFNYSGIHTVLSADHRYLTNQGLDVMRHLQGNDIAFGDKLLTIMGGDEYRFLDVYSSSTNKNAPFWYYAWNAITTANKMLNYLDDETVGTNKKLQDFKARGLTVRAYAYNFLMENYQDAYMQGGEQKLGMPLYDFYSPIQADKARSSSKETYDFIKKDLAEAARLFGLAGIGYTTVSSDIDMAVVNFIAARVNLITGEYKEAIKNAIDILAQYPNLLEEKFYGGKNTGTKALPELRPEQNGFLNNEVNPEVILGFSVGEAQTRHNYWMNPFGEGFGGLSEGFQRIDNRLYEKIAASDYRKAGFMDAAWGDYTYPTNGDKRNIPVLTNLKFAATHGLGSDDKKQVGKVTAYYMRSSEALLMLAEAQALDGQEAAAKATLNQLLAARTAKGATTLTCDNYPGMTGLSAHEMVQLQTRIELWGEGGKEYYNNRRWNIPVDRRSSITHVDKSQYPVAKMTVQIPDDEILYNNLMEQN